MDAKQTLGQPRALIDRAALLHNIRLLKSAAGPAKICAVLKADAYGHGADIVVDTLCNFADEGAEPPLIDAIAVASIDEASALPESNLPVLIFRPVENTYLGRERQRLETALREGWTLTIGSPSAADDLARLATTLGLRASVQIMVDTGMTRSGCDPAKFADVLATVLAHPSLKLWGICTHFASSEDSDPVFTTTQLERFKGALVGGLDHPSLRGRTPVLHAANSGAIFFHPQSRLDMVRPGICLYGIDPTGRPSLDRKLKPVLKWTAPIVSIQDIPAGVGVGYGQTWKASRVSRIGLIPVGYADGYLRAFSDNAKVMLHNQPADVVGRVSMDLLTIDLTDHPHARPGDEVTLIDSDPLSPASVYELARRAGTIPYEIFCRIGNRVPRVVVEPAVAIAPRSTDAAA